MIRISRLLFRTHSLLQGPQLVERAVCFCGHLQFVWSNARSQPSAVFLYWRRIEPDFEVTNKNVARCGRDGVNARDWAVNRCSVQSSARIEKRAASAR